MVANVSRRDSLDLARLAIARFQVEGDDGPLRAIRHATRTSAEKLDCARVGVWLFVDDTKRAITAPMVFDLARQTYDEDGQTLHEELCPSYFQAIREHRTLVVSDALTDPRTRELADSYLASRRIGALLDVPIYRLGDIVGILCHEHVGGPRSWTDAECAFATSVADMLAVVLEGAHLLGHERELRVLERHAAEARHDESIARIAGAIGHDINNLLAVIVAATSTAASVGASAAVIRDAAERGAALAKELLLLAREESGPSRAPASVALALESLRSVIDQLVAPHPLDWSVDVDGVRVPADAQELERITLNLVKNARDAIVDDGRVSVRAFVDDERVLIEVGDTGRGMSPAVAQRVFDPFFTTKAGGSGLGLATVKALVGRRGGRVSIESREGHGTTFTVAFPRM